MIGQINPTVKFSKSTDTNIHSKSTKKILKTPIRTELTEECRRL